MDLFVVRDRCANSNALYGANGRTAIPQRIVVQRFRYFEQVVNIRKGIYERLPIKFICKKRQRVIIKFT